MSSELAYDVTVTCNRHTVYNTTCTAMFFSNDHVVIFTVCTQSQRHTSRWWSCQKHLKECRYWKYVEYKTVASFLSLPRLNSDFLQQHVKAVSNHKLEVWNTWEQDYKAACEPDFIVKIIIYMSFFCYCSSCFAKTSGDNKFMVIQLVLKLQVTYPI